jgi:hypothetical protein
MTQYLRPITRRVTIPSLAARPLLAATAIIAAMATPALAAPAGDEYLPKVPKAAGKELATGENGGGTILEPGVRGAGQNGDGSGGGDPAQGAGSLQPASAADSDSGSSALLDPIVLLVIAGVVAATAAMMLRRRQADGEVPDRPGGTPRETSSERPTPDGRIVNGEDGPGGGAAPDPPEKDEG